MNFKIRRCGWGRQMCVKYTVVDKVLQHFVSWHCILQVFGVVVCCDTYVCSVNGGIHSRSWSMMRWNLNFLLKWTRCSSCWHPAALQCVDYPALHHKHVVAPSSPWPTGYPSPPPRQGSCWTSTATRMQLLLLPPTQCEAQPSPCHRTQKRCAIIQWWCLLRPASHRCTPRWLPPSPPHGPDGRLGL